MPQSDKVTIYSQVLSHVASYSSFYALLIMTLYVIYCIIVLTQIISKIIQAYKNFFNIKKEPLLNNKNNSDKK